MIQLKKVVLFFLFGFSSILSFSQTTVYVCSTNGSYGFCYGNQNTGICAYNECIKRGGKTPYVILNYPGKGYGAIAIGKSDNGKQVVGASAGYPDYKSAINRAKEECKLKGGINPNITHTFFDKKNKEKDKENISKGKKTENDDFWSGKKNNNGKNAAKDNFWNEKSTEFEKNIKSNNLSSLKSNQFIGEIESKTKTIKIVCRDHGKEDGDRVQIRNNKSIIRSNLYLTNKPKRVVVKLKWGMNRIDFTALNQGSVGMNTAEFEVYDDSGKRISKKKWSISKGYTATLLIIKL